MDVAQGGLDLKRELDELMNRWARWSISHGINLDYPHQTPFRRLVGASVSVEPILDREAEEIDEAVSQLGVFNPTAREVAVLYYLHRVPLRKMREINHRLTYARVQNEKAYIDGWLGQKLFNLMLT